MELLLVICIADIGLWLMCNLLYLDHDALECISPSLVPCYKNKYCILNFSSTRYFFLQKCHLILESHTIFTILSMLNAYILSSFAVKYANNNNHDTRPPGAHIASTQTSDKSIATHAIWMQCSPTALVL